MHTSRKIVKLLCEFIESLRTVGHRDYKRNQSRLAQDVILSRLARINNTAIFIKHSNKEID